MAGHYLGYVAACCFVYCLLYKKINIIIAKVRRSKLLKYHYVLGSMGLIIVLIHVLLSMVQISITSGTISLFIFIGVLISGLIIVKSKNKIRKIAVDTHIKLSIMAVLFMIFHIAENIILNR